jgi:hypothetical protein
MAGDNMWRRTQRDGGVARVHAGAVPLHHLDPRVMRRAIAGTDPNDHRQPGGARIEVGHQHQAFGFADDLRLRLLGAPLTNA